MQLDIHNQIDILSQEKVMSASEKDVIKLVNLNDDARDYFYSKIESSYVDWLYDNGFFNCLSSKQDPKSRLGMPELWYLDRAAKDQPASVVQIILNTKISKNNFNPDVVSRFVRIMSNLPADQIACLIPKLTKENWVKLLNRYNHWGFEYEDMFKTLMQAQNYQAILDLAGAVLSVKVIADLRGGSPIYIPEDDTFYFDNLIETGVFTALQTLPLEHQESALKLVSDTLASVVDLWDSQSEKIKNPDNPFDKNDHLMLASYIPSDIKPKEQGGNHREDNLYNLVATLLYMFDNLVTSDPNPTNIKKLYHSYFAPLPNSQAMCRLKLYIMKRFPDYFATEYAEAIEKGYAKIESTLDEPMIGPIISGNVVNRSPLTQEEFNKLSIETIVVNLQSVWTPSALAEASSSGDMFNPLAPDAIGDLLRDDILNRPQEYLNSAKLFFNRESIHLHYTHRYLASITEYVKTNRAQASKHNWDNLIKLIGGVLKSDRKEPSNERGSWIANWDWIYSTICELLSELLTVDGDTSPIDFNKYRSQLLAFIEILFQYPDPSPKDEDIKTATSITSNYGDKDREITDPYTMAINSVRGKAHRTLLGFVYRDGKQLNKDVKALYEQIIEKENTRTIYFLFGHQIAPFYYRDKEYAKKILKIIFHNSHDDLLSLAAWEGYLSNNLFHEIFNEKFIQRLYTTSIGKSAQYPNQKHFLDPQKGLAGHLALAFMYYPEFSFGDPLFKKFWKDGTSTQQVEFITIIGRNLTSNQDKRYLTKIKQNPTDIASLQKLWSLLLDGKYKPEVIESFGYWVGPENDIFDLGWLAKQVRLTMELTKGKLNWDYGLTQIITKLAGASPKDILDVTRLFFTNLIDDSSRHPTERYVEKEWKEAIDIVYKSGENEQVNHLIDQLISKGGRAFWTLKDIIHA